MGLAEQRLRAVLGYHFVEALALQQTGSFAEVRARHAYEGNALLAVPDSQGLAVKETSFEQRALREDERDQRVAWNLRAADWLDPTTSVRWLDVDDAPPTPF